MSACHSTCTRHKIRRAEAGPMTLLLTIIDSLPSLPPPVLAHPSPVPLLPVPPGFQLSVPPEPAVENLATFPPPPCPLCCHPPPVAPRNKSNSSAVKEQMHRTGKLTLLARPSPISSALAGPPPANSSGSHSTAASPLQLPPPLPSPPDLIGEIERPREFIGEYLREPASSARFRQAF